MDDLSSGQRKNADMLVANGAKFIEADILTIPEFPHAKLIYHLACPASPPFYQADPVRTWKISVIGTMRVAEWALKIGARILFTSTSEVYGDPLQHPQKESYWGNVNPIGIRSCYDEGKRAAETLLMDMHRSKVNWFCCFFFLFLKLLFAVCPSERLHCPIVQHVWSLYGSQGWSSGFQSHSSSIEGLRLFCFVCLFVCHGLFPKGEPMTVYGSGQQTRSFCFVNDTVDGLIKLMESQEVGPINIGNPQERTILDAAQVIQRVVGSSVPIVHLPLPHDDPTRRQPDITLAKSRLNWQPKTNYEEGLPPTIAFFKTCL